ncbi:hypothetical protein LX32DRAFT_224007 [Colletotrichum zoysiae]|uniref:Uncharacterized protein n=1 Tax=Colletotrichum zoysiae TaxID=1216348 RepID=A0AAD9LUT1_9PEZI|nr:hypothetical protein LX32DRAFT_224007 [Colletotrichum zoysiae]
MLYKTDNTDNTRASGTMQSLLFAMDGWMDGWMDGYCELRCAHIISLGRRQIKRISMYQVCLSF